MWERTPESQGKPLPLRDATQMNQTHMEMLHFSDSQAPLIERHAIEGTFGEKAELHRVSAWEMWARKGPGESRDLGAGIGMRRPPESCPSSTCCPRSPDFTL